MPFAALAEETSYFSSRRRRSAKSSACCASLKARAANSRFCSAPGVLFILCKRRRALSRRSIRVAFSAAGSLRIARSQAARTRIRPTPTEMSQSGAIWKISPLQKCNLIGAFPLCWALDRPRRGNRGSAIPIWPLGFAAQNVRGSILDTAIHRAGNGGEARASHA